MYCKFKKEIRLDAKFQVKKFTFALFLAIFGKDLGH